MSFSIANLKDVRDQSTRVRVDRRLQRPELHPERRGRAPGPERGRARQRPSGHLGHVRDPGQAADPGPRRSARRRRRPGAAGVVLLGEGFWERRFGRDPGVVGRALVLSGETFTVIGVMPKSMHGELEDHRGLHAAAAARGPDRGRGQPRQPPGHLRGRPLKPGVAVEQARSRGEDDRRAARRALPELEREAEHDASSRCTRRWSATCARR